EKETTDKLQCQILVETMYFHGVRHAVVSPGSRNAPLIIALSRSRIKTHVVVDERSAAYVALGMAQQLKAPVALVCTSGTALLNYAPAVAEAYYQKLPLIVVSADRPQEWIDQDDSQTIRQFQALSQFVKRSYDIPARCDDETAVWYAERIANDAMMEATSLRRAPVHINVQLAEPLNGLTTDNYRLRRIHHFPSIDGIGREDTLKLAEQLMGKRVMIIAGFMQINEHLRQALNAIAAKDLAVVLTETISNMGDDFTINAIDRTLLAIDEDDKRYRPDVVITIGGAIVSRKIKAYLRKVKAEHWYVGMGDVTVDCFQNLTRRIDANPDTFIPLLFQHAHTVKSFRTLWQDAHAAGLRRHERYLEEIGWSDMKAYEIIFKFFYENPDDLIMQLSNGTTIRYAQLFGDRVIVPNFCNRGVSGIDGCTSTAIGAAIINGPAVLITGDMSFFYDISALSALTPKVPLKIIVVDNGGGGIFRFVGSTSSLPELEKYFVVKRNLDVEKVAASFGIKTFSADNEDCLYEQISNLMAESGPALLVVKTDGKRSAEILKNYFNPTK
ncbi:MAG: 2-succinyl-5-enolpyruvyl-6-hydroxy-3-cyclohexene-1-carboxylic-acid synthase, partial [Bacteroidales bacterium]|nr:2-succinyl-5-enolpyruvyl-6-hydroxy-3-cyclohexene-1-carboxylic-acid synthase [Bacteroidales bacterium]